MACLCASAVCARQTRRPRQSLTPTPRSAAVLMHSHSTRKMAHTDRRSTSSTCERHRPGTLN